MFRSHHLKLVSAILMFLFLGNGGAQAMPLKDFCSYSISDYDLIRNDVEALFPSGLTSVEARAKLSELGMSKIKEIQLIETKNRKAILIDGKPVKSKEKLIGVRIECPLPEKNQNIWEIILHINEFDAVQEMGFYILVHDEDFAIRGIPLRAAYVRSEKDIFRVIRSLAQQKFPEWKNLREHLLQAGFRVLERTDKGSKNSSAIIKKSSDFNHLATRLLGGDGLQARIVISEKGTVLKVLD